MQPGYQNHLVTLRYRPTMIVSHALVTPMHRPSITALPNYYLVGDWVGTEGMLLDASLASARSTAQLILSGEPREAA